MAFRDSKYIQIHIRSYEDGEGEVCALMTEEHYQMFYPYSEDIVHIPIDEIEEYYPILFPREANRDEMWNWIRDFEITYFNRLKINKFPTCA